MLAWQIRRYPPFLDDTNLSDLVAGFSERDEAMEYLRTRNFSYYTYSLEFKEEA